MDIVTYALCRKYTDDIIASTITTLYKIKGSEDVSFLNNLDKSAELNGCVYNLTNDGNLLNSDGTTLAVSNGDNVVFIWEEDNWYWNKLSATIDLSGYVPTSRTIAGNALTADITALALFNSILTVTDVTVDED